MPDKLSEVAGWIVDIFVRVLMRTAKRILGTDSLNALVEASIERAVEKQLSRLDDVKDLKGLIDKVF